MKDYNLTLITPPVIEPVDLTAAKAYLRVDDITNTIEDALMCYEKVYKNA